MIKIATFYSKLGFYVNAASSYGSKVFICILPGYTNSKCICFIQPSRSDNYVYQKFLSNFSRDTNNKFVSYEVNRVCFNIFDTFWMRCTLDKAANANDLEQAWLKSWGLKPDTCIVGKKLHNPSKLRKTYKGVKFSNEFFKTLSINDPVIEVKLIIFYSKLTLD